jgi:predicted phosphodiesterase
MAVRGSGNSSQSLQDYYHQLTRANLIESANPYFCLELLEKCLSYLESSNLKDNSYPKHVSILKSRVGYLKTFNPERNKTLHMKSKSSNWKSTTTNSGTMGIGEVESQQDLTSYSSDSLSNSDLGEEKSEIGESGGISIIRPEKKVLHSIFQEVYNILIEEQDVSYEQYLLFFQELNRLFSEPRPTIVRDNRNLIYYIGDTHGSYSEAKTMIQYFQKIIDQHSSVRFVFLGDYVDRNPKDLENLTLIVAFSVLYPDNVVLLRGNHEDDVINKNYGFYRNLEEAFIIQNRVESLYSEILAYFMKLSIVHLDSMFDSQNNRSIRIMAVHGGIPVNVENAKLAINLEEMEKTINPQIETYQKFDHFMNWLLWADPKEDMAGIIYDRFSGRSQFGPDAFDLFMNENQLDFFVRAHEKWPDGIHWFFNHRLVSLFSTSYYNGVKIGDGKILRLQPGKAPAILHINETFLNDDAENLK